jgi:muconate cycloisomerase
MIHSIEVIPLRLPVAQELILSRGKAVQKSAGAPHVLVKITDDDGIVGWGEARPSPKWSYETHETAISTIRNFLAPAIIGMDPFDLDAIHRKMSSEIAPGVQIGQPIAKSAIDIALHDLIGKKLGISVQKYLGSQRLREIKLGWVVSAHSIDEAVKQAQEGLNRGYHGFKVKTGIHVETDVEMVREISAVAKGKYLWIDANQGWDLNTAVRYAREMVKFGVNVLEQPLPADDIHGYATLVARSDIPVALDESIYTPRDLLNFLKLNALNGLVIKVCRCGGLYWSRQIAHIAQAAGLILLGSGLTEARLSLTSSCHIFSAFGVDTPVDLNGPQFLADDMMPGKLEYPGQVVPIPDAPGLGVEPDMEKVERYREK